MEDFDWSAAITMGRRLLDAVFSLEFLAKHGPRLPTVDDRRQQRSFRRIITPRPLECGLGLLSRAGIVFAIGAPTGHSQPLALAESNRTPDR